MLRARCDLPMPEPERLLALFCEHYVEHGTVRRRGTAGRVAMPFGSFALHAGDNRLSVRAKAPSEDGLTYVKWGVVHHLNEFLSEAAPSVRWQGHSKTGETPSFWRDMQVVEAFDVTPAMRRVVLSGHDLGAMAEGGLHVRLFFPPKGRPLRGPVLGEDGCPVWPDGENKLTPRVYTIRAVDVARGEVAIDILRHDGDATPGSFFAVNARAGDAVGMAGPLGDDAVPASRRLFFFGDETAIPAIDRILRRLPADAKAQVVVEVANRAEEQPFRSAAEVTVEWLHRDAPARSLSERAEAITPQALGRDGYVWAACEFGDFQAIRRHCRKVLGLKPDRHHVVAYWRKGAAGE